MRTNWRRGVKGIVVLAAAVACAPGEASGAVTLMDRFSSVTADAFARAGFGGTTSTDTDSNGTTTFGPFNDTVSAETGFEVSTSTAEADAFQNSTVSLVGSSFIGADAQGTADTFVLASQQDFAEATATSEFVIQFSIPAGESYNYTLGGDIAKSGQSGVEIYLDQLLPLYEVQFFRTGANPGSFNTSGTLGAGKYKLSAYTAAINTDLAQGTASSSFSIDFDLTPVPEPGTLALIALPAALLARRRRVGAAVR